MAQASHEHQTFHMWESKLPKAQTGPAQGYTHLPRQKESEGSYDVNGSAHDTTAKNSLEKR